MFLFLYLLYSVYYNIGSHVAAKCLYILPSLWSTPGSLIHVKVAKVTTMPVPFAGGRNEPTKARVAFVFEGYSKINDASCY